MAKMETTLLATKLLVPPARSGLISRPRLLERLRPAPGVTFTLVSAPAGFGKTTLLSAWVHSRLHRQPTVWLSLDAGDNDPSRFWNYFVAAVRSAHPGFGNSTLALLRSPQPPPVESLLTVLINELASLPTGCVVILDDYHLISTPAIHNGIAFLLDHVPVKVSLIIATRADPPLPLAHFRGKGAMVEVRADDLRFNEEEAIGLFGVLKNPGMSKGDAVRLNHRTQGWVVGLKMAALAMPRQSDISDFITGFTGSQRFVMDYLMEEVLRRQTEDVWDFLLRTSVLDRLTAALCDTVTGRNDSRDMLLALEHSNLFVAPLDESRQWYRYEHLFLDVLRHQLEVKSGPEAVTELNRRASQWFEANGFADEAIHHALKGTDWMAATRLIHKHLKEKGWKGELATLLHWLEQLPEEVRNRDLSLCRTYGNLLNVAGEFESAAAIADYLERAAGTDDALLGHVAAMRSGTAHGRGDMNRALELGMKALELLPKDQVDMRCIVSERLGFIHWNRGDFKAAEPLLTEAYAAGVKAGDNHVAAEALSLLAAADHSSTGRLRLAIGRYRQAIELAGPTPAAGSSHQSLGWTLYELNDLDEAVRQIERALELGRLTGQRGFVARQHALLAHCCLAQGKESEALAKIEEARLVAESTGRDAVRAEHAAYHIRIALRLNDLTTATEWGHKLQEDVGALPFYHQHVPLRLLIAQGKRALAARRLQALYEQATSHGMQYQVICTRVCQVLAADTMDSALRFLADVFAITEPEGYLRTFVDEGGSMGPFLRQSIARGIRPEYASRLLSIIDREHQRLTEQEERSPTRAPLPVTERELEVLRLLVTGISSRQIAAALTISLDTTNTHIRHIYEQLDCRSRIQAVARARELGLI